MFIENYVTKIVKQINFIKHKNFTFVIYRITFHEHVKHVIFKFMADSARYLIHIYHLILEELHEEVVLGDDIKLIIAPSYFTA